MTGHYIIFLIFSSAIIFLSGCATKCFDFNNDIINWMPYKANDSLIITDSSQTDTLKVNYSEIYHTKTVAFGVKCPCENAFILNLSSDSLNIDIRFNNSADIQQSEIVINDEWIGYSRHLDTYTLNNTNYSDVIIYTNTSQYSHQRFLKVVISKSIGIIAIYENNNEWIVPGNSPKQIQIKDIQMKATDC